MSRADAGSDPDDDRPTSAEDLVDVHGREPLERLADAGSVAAQAALDLVDEEDADR